MIKFENLNDRDKSFIKVVHQNSDLKWDARMKILMDKYGRSERTIRIWIKKLGFSNYRHIENDEVRQAKLKTYSKKSYYIITWSQNATPRHDGFWKNILKYSDHLDAEVIVIQGRYQNPTSLWTKNMKNDEWWDPAFHPYMSSNRHDIHPNLEIISDVKIIPTASDPLNGFESLSGDKSSIFGHPKVNLKSLPVLEGHPSKLILTTGACTMKNYTDTKAGKLAEFHHTYGFVIVEIKDDQTFYIRQVTADNDGSFIDLNTEVKNEKIEKINKCSAFIFGDLHVANLHRPVVEETFNLFSKIKPGVIVFHDIFDGESISHHESKDPIKRFEKYKEGRHLLKGEIEGLKDFINKYNVLKYNPVVVRSNHDYWLEKWVKDSDWKKDISNSIEYMEYSLALLSGKAPKGLIPYILEKEYGSKIKCLDDDDSFKVQGWELAHHGHLGANGTKGSIEHFRKLNTKVVVGDYHTPGRKGGALSVGTYSRLRLGYNKGASSWMHSGVIIHENGKAQHIIFQKDDKFTTLL